MIVYDLTQNYSHRKYLALETLKLISHVTHDREIESPGSTRQKKKESRETKNKSLDGERTERKDC